MAYFFPVADTFRVLQFLEIRVPQFLEKSEKNENDKAYRSEWWEFI